MRLLENQWSILDSLLPKPKIRKDKRGRPWRGNKEVLEGILWVLKTGARWKDLPKEYPPYQTCHRRFQMWREDGVMDKILEVLATELFYLGILELSESYIDGTFTPAKKGAFLLEKQKKEKEQKSWGLSILQVFLLDYPLKVLHHTKLHLLKNQLGVFSLPVYQLDLLGTKHMILMALTKSWPKNIASK